MVCFVALLLYRVMRMRLKASKREESPTRLLEQLRRIQHQTAKAQDGRKISGLTEISATQKSLLSALKLALEFDSLSHCGNTLSCKNNRL